MLRQPYISLNLTHWTYFWSKCPRSWCASLLNILLTKEISILKFLNILIVSSPDVLSVIHS